MNNQRSWEEEQLLPHAQELEQDLNLALIDHIRLFLKTSNGNPEHNPNLLVFLSQTVHEMFRMALKLKTETDFGRAYYEYFVPSHGDLWNDETMELPELHGRRREGPSEYVALTVAPGVRIKQKADEFVDEVVRKASVITTKSRPFYWSELDERHFHPDQCKVYLKPTRSI